MKKMIEEKCPVCGNSLMEEHWGNFGDMEEVRKTCSVLTCALEPYLTTKLKGEEDAT